MNKHVEEGARRTMNLFTCIWLGILGIFTGLRYPRFKTSMGDNRYIELSRGEFLMDAEIVIAGMIEDGITYKQFYVSDFFDCVDFARVFVGRFLVAMRKTVTQSDTVKGLGIPVDVRGIQIKERGGHAVILAVLDGKRTYWEPYPEYFKELFPDNDELATLSHITF